MFNLDIKIIILDDMSTIRKIVKKTLKEMGFNNITEAVDGNDAWTHLNAAVTPFDLIISDWNMPNCTGIELLKRVRADQRYAKTPFILLTAEVEAHQVSEALKEGVSNYIVKPFAAETLKQKIEQTHKKVTSAA